MKLMHIAFATVLFATLSSAQAQTPKDGVVKISQDGTTLAWDGQASQWTDIESFWLRYANRRGGLTWGQRDTYPEYEKVKELDTLIIQLKQGPCLMEFFHSRWRRANDVRRWDDAFNEYGGCPHVFD